MTLLNEADAIYAGSSEAAAVYLGANKVWPAAPAGPSASLLVSYTPGADRNDFEGEVGVRLGIGGANIPFTWMGARRHHASQTGTHTVKLYEWFSSALVRSAVIDFTGVAVGEYAWVAVPATTLLAGGYYPLMLVVHAYDGQPWGNTPAPVSMVPGITNIYGCYYAGGFGTTGINEMFNGLDLGW